MLGWTKGKVRAEYDKRVSNGEVAEINEMECAEMLLAYIEGEIEKATGNGS